MKWKRSRSFGRISAMSPSPVADRQTGVRAHFAPSPQSPSATGLDHAPVSTAPARRRQAGSYGNRLRSNHALAVLAALPAAAHTGVLGPSPTSAMLPRYCPATTRSVRSRCHCQAAARNPLETAPSGGYQGPMSPVLSTEHRLAVLVARRGLLVLRQNGGSCPFARA